MKNIVILASGNGSNYQYITNTIKNLNLDIDVCAVICNKPDAGVVQKSTDNNHNLIIKESTGLSRDRYDLELVSEILNLNKAIDLIILAGWMRILTKNFINAFESIINLHPALPGMYPGASAIADAFTDFQKGKITKTGVMVHKVIEKLDAGEVVDSVEVSIEKGDTLDTLTQRVQKCEKPLLMNSIMKVLNNVEEETVTSKPQVISGKVRDRWDIGNDLLCFYHSDRLSSFDRHICNIDGKGRMLNLINEWWMNNTRHIIDNHLLHVNGSYLISKKCTLIPLEIIVRGYITGNTQTSLWTHYNKHFNVDKSSDKFSYCGIEFPNNLVKNQKLPSPVLTPTTKGERDELISYQQILDEGFVTKDVLDYIYKKARQLFDYGTYVANQKGLILVDTKYEFGYDVNGNIILIDEIHTCDSSRYWLKETYSLDSEPQKLDKDAARDYVKKLCDPYTVEQIPEVPPEQKARVFECYKGLYERLTMNSFNEEVVSDVVANVDSPVIANYYENVHSPTIVILSGSPSDDWHIEKLRTKFKEQNLYFREHICSAHKKTKQLLKILDQYNENKNRKLVFITVAGMSNALSGVVACNTHHPVIACPPHTDKVDMMTNINSTLQMPSKVPVATIVNAGNVAMFCKKILE